MKNLGLIPIVTIWITIALVLVVFTIGDVGFNDRMPAQEVMTTVRDITKRIDSLRQRSQNAVDNFVITAAVGRRVLPDDGIKTFQNNEAPVDITFGDYTAGLGELQVVSQARTPQKPLAQAVGDPINEFSPPRSGDGDDSEALEEAEVGPKQRNGLNVSASGSSGIDTESDTRPDDGDGDQDASQPGDTPEAGQGDGGNGINAAQTDGGNAGGGNDNFTDGDNRDSDGKGKGVDAPNGQGTPDSGAGNGKGPSSSTGKGTPDNGTSSHKGPSSSTGQGPPDSGAGSGKGPRSSTGQGTPDSGIGHETIQATLKKTTMTMTMKTSARI